MPPPLCKVSRAVPRTIAMVPAISETVSVLPNISTPNMAANKGVVEVKVDVKVGPKRRTEIRAKLAETSGETDPRPGR